MLLSDMSAGSYAFILLRRKPKGFRMPRKRPSRRRRSSDRLREIVGTRPYSCELFGHSGFDMRIGRAGAARRRQRELARYALRMLERRFRIRIVVASRRIMDAENFEGRLIDENFDSLRNHTGDGADRITHRRMRGEEKGRAEPASHLGIVGTDRRADGDQRPGQSERRLQEFRKPPPGNS